MSTLLHAAANLLLRDPQWVDRPILSTSTSTADFSIATVPNPPPPSSMDGAVYDVFPASSVTSTLATALATGVAQASSAAAASAAAAATMAASSGSPHDGDDRGECRLLGPFALFVQLALGGLALMSLVYKRWRERPQRPLKIWFFDASKQVFGSVLVHMANVFMSMLTSGRFSVTVEPAAVSITAAAVVRRFAGPEGQSGDEYTPNPCSFYLLNLAIDVSLEARTTQISVQSPFIIFTDMMIFKYIQTTVGIPILILLLRIFTHLVSYTPMGNPPESIQSGNYGSPPRAWWWLKQSLIYFCGLFGMKFCVLIIFIMFPWISRVGDWALGWTEGNEKLQIVFVMMLFPLIMNALQYYIIDSFIKAQASKDDTGGHEVGRGEGSSGNGGGGGGSYQRIAPSDEHEEGVESSSVDGDDILAKAKLGSQISKSASPVREEYDPEVDGDRTAATTTTGGSSTLRPEGTVPKELLPKE